MEVQKENVKGEIYQIRNKTDGKIYVGQVVTHRKNKGVYKPFGTLGRFRDHISEAICNTKKKQCWYLNSAIRKYGNEMFEVEHLETCERNVMDEREQFYIKERNSLYPNGYNLTRGGKTLENIQIDRDTETKPSRKRGGCIERSEETRQRIAAKLKAHTSDSSIREKRSQHAHHQHLKAKVDRFHGIAIYPTNLNSYIRHQTKRTLVTIEGKQATFHGTLEERERNALEFLQLIAQQSATLPN